MTYRLPVETTTWVPLADAAHILRVPTLPLPDGALGVACTTIVGLLHRGSRPLDGSHRTDVTWDDLYDTGRRAVLAFAERIVDALNSAGYLTPDQDALDFGEPA